MALIRAASKGVNLAAEGSVSIVGQFRAIGDLGFMAGCTGNGADWMQAPLPVPWLLI
jgi:hypothetical protein